MGIFKFSQSFSYFVVLSLTLKQLKDFTSRVSMKTSTGTLREMYQHQQNNDGNLDFVGFKKLMIDFLHDQQVGVTWNIIICLTNGFASFRVSIFRSLLTVSEGTPTIQKGVA